MGQPPGTKAPSFAFTGPSTYSLNSSYPSTTEYLGDDFNSTTYGRYAAMYAGQHYTPDYVESMAPSLPSMVPSDNYKSEQQYSGSEFPKRLERAVVTNVSFASVTQNGGDKRGGFPK